MLKIRLKRTGRKKKPFYKIVLMENLSKRDGKAIEELGYYDPLTKIIHFKYNLASLFVNFYKKKEGKTLTHLYP